ncbi:cell envelope biogenesis protein OmpA, partial [Bacteroides stercoris]
YTGDLNGDTGNNDLIYIPTDEEVDRMTFSPTSAYTAEQQKANFKAWLSRDEYMKEHRGEYFKRNAGNEKFEHHFDFHLSHRLQFMLGKSKRELEFSLDIINIGNMLNKDWGRTSASYGYYNPINYKGDGSFQFLHDADYNMRSYNDYYSRWRGQTGVRLIF